MPSMPMHLAMAGHVPAIPFRKVRRSTDRDQRHKAGDDVDVEPDGRQGASCDVSPAPNPDPLSHTMR